MQDSSPSTHERLTDSQEIQGSSDRSFGVVMAIFFAIVGLWPLLSGGAPRWWSMALVAALAAIAIVRPALLAPLNRLWLKFGLLLNRIVSPLIMGLLFYGMVTPYALVMRLAGKDPLRLRFDPAAKSYWIERDPPGPAPESMKHQF